MTYNYYRIKNENEEIQKANQRSLDYENFLSEKTYGGYSTNDLIKLYDKDNHYNNSINTANFEYLQQYLIFRRSGKPLELWNKSKPSFIVKVNKTVKGLLLNRDILMS